MNFLKTLGEKPTNSIVFSKFKLNAWKYVYFSSICCGLNAHEERPQLLIVIIKKLNSLYSMSICTFVLFNGLAVDQQPMVKTLFFIQKRSSWVIIIHSNKLLKFLF